MLVNNLFSDSCKDQIMNETRTLVSIEERDCCVLITAEEMMCLVDISVIINSATEIT